MISSRRLMSPVLSMSLAGLLSWVGACNFGDDLLPSSRRLARLCQSPRTGNDPVSGRAYTDKPGTLDDEKAWLRSWIDEYYLWYREVPDVKPSDYPTAIDYFGALKTPAKTASGAPKDKFHFTFETTAWDMLSQSGVEAGYGVRWSLIAPAPPRKIVVAYTEPGSEGAATLKRGAEVLTIDGVDVMNGTDVNTLNNGLYPSDVNQKHTFVVRFVGDNASHTVMLTSANITGHPVQNVSTIAGGEVGYVLFNDHIQTAEAAWIAAINQLKTAGIKDLVLDMRYNGGGYLAIAAELGYMIAGDAGAGKTFELEQFNDKYPTTDPITGEALAPLPFLDKAEFDSTHPPLPTLGLSRVFVLTGRNTCSASEAVMNALRGIAGQVIQIGTT